jgi:hypothetical protein
MQVRVIAATVGLAALALSSITATALAQPAPVDRPAELRTGACDSPGELVVSLAHLVVTLGDPQGQTGAQPVEQSGTVVPYTVTDLLDANHIVTVLESPQVDLLVACGEIGGTLNPDGTLAVGMRSMNGSGLSGVAYFTPNPGFDNTLITILLVGDGSAEADSSVAEPVR